MTDNAWGFLAEPPRDVVAYRRWKAAREQRQAERNVDDVEKIAWARSINRPDFDAIGWEEALRREIPDVVCDKKGRPI